MFSISSHLLLVLANLTPFLASAHSDNVSRHLLMEDLNMVVILADAEQIQGPFPGDEEDYVTTTPDITVTGRAGSPGLEEDRSTVTEGIPLSLTINIFNVANQTVEGVVEAFENVEVTLWSCDAIGVYSAVDDGNLFQSNVMGLGDQIWLRGRQVTGADGTVTFQTIMPGWYSGRTIHFHVRLRFPGEVDFAATTQLYITDDDLALYKGLEPYVSNSIEITPLATDEFYGRVDPVVGEMLQLTLNGTADTGFETAINLGLAPGSVSDFPGAWMLPPALAQADAPVASPASDASFSQNKVLPLVMASLLAALVGV